MRISRFWRLCSRTHFFPTIPKIEVGCAKSCLKSPDEPDDPMPSYSSHVDIGSIDQDLVELKYPQSIQNKATKIHQGMLLDALSIFPIHLRPLVCRSKYLMVCCFIAPVLSDSEEYIPDLISVCSEIRSVYGSDFEVILAGKMGHRWSNHRPSFDHFFSAFPSFCHLVPFSEHNARDLLCYQFGVEVPLHKFALLERSATCNIYKVLRTGSLDFFQNYGADCFPFDENILHARNQLQESIGLSFPTKLDQLFGQNYSQVQVFKFDLPEPAGAGGTPLSKLQSRVVGLYLCADGSLIRRLDNVYRQCKDRGLDFEVVLVYMPFTSPCKFHKFIEIINEELYRLQGNKSSWWIMPFTDSISRRLLTLCPESDDFSHGFDDRLVIFGPDGDYVDPHAGVILGQFGIDVYPFTRNRLIQWELEKVRSLTLESLLVYGDLDYVLGKDNTGSIVRVPVSQLRGRVILFLFDRRIPEDYESELSSYYSRLKSSPEELQCVSPALLYKYYSQLKSAHPSFEVVMVLTPYHKVASLDLPWLICPFEPDHSAFVSKILGCGDDPYALIAFGVDGRVSSYRPLDHLESKGVEAFPFHGDLRKETISHLCHRYSDWTIFDKIMADLNLVNTVDRSRLQ